MTLYQQNGKLLRFVLTLYFISWTNGEQLQHDLEEKPKTPKVYKIIEKNNNIVLKRDLEEYDPAVLVEFLKNNADLEFRIKNILNKDDPSLLSNGLKKRLIKRKVEHGQDTADLQYDPKKSMYFKPLIRFHKTKKLTSNPEQEPVRNIKEKSKKGTPPIIELDVIRNYLKNQLMDKLDGLTPKRKESLKKKDPKKVSLYGYGPVYREEIPSGLNNAKDYRPTETEHAIRHLNEVSKLIDKVMSTSLKKEAHTKLERIIFTIEQLHRNLLRATSEELRKGPPTIEEVKGITTKKPYPEVSLVPGVNLDVFAEDNDVTERPCPLYPHQSLWNYWTYKNQIHIDDCPPHLVKVDNVCVRHPPHKK